MGETSLFYNPGAQLANGIYFVTIKEEGRPAKGGVIEVGGAFDFAGVGELVPHPIYAWMGWVQILSPSRAEFDALLPLLDDSYAAARVKFARAVGGHGAVK